MKKIAFLSLLLLANTAQAGIAKIAMLVGASLSGKTAYDSYQIEKGNNKPVDGQLELAKNTKEKMLFFAEKVEDKKNKWLSSKINLYGKSAEKFESFHPETTKFGLLAAVLFILSIFF